MAAGSIAVRFRYRRQQTHRRQTANVIHRAHRGGNEPGKSEERT